MWSDQVMVEPARKITSINILAGTLFVSMLANIVLASVLGTYTSDNQCKQDRVGVITEGRVEQARIIKKNNNGVVFDNSHEGDECVCQGTAWELLEVLILACILTFFLHGGLRAGWKIRQLCVRWQGAREDRMRQQILSQQRMEQERKAHRSGALQCVRDIQAEQEL